MFYAIIQIKKLMEMDFMEKKKDLLLDVDEVIAFSGFLEAINEFLGTNHVCNR